MAASIAGACGSGYQFLYMNLRVKKVIFDRISLSTTMIGALTVMSKVADYLWLIGRSCTYRRLNYELY